MLFSVNIVGRFILGKTLCHFFACQGIFNKRDPRLTLKVKGWL